MQSIRIRSDRIGPISDECGVGCGGGSISAAAAKLSAKEVHRVATTEVVEKIICISLSGV